MNINQFFPTTYIKASDLGDKEFHVTITGWRLEEMTDRNQRKSQKPVLYFQGAGKGLVLIKHNAGVIGALYGPNLEDWVGKRITLYIERDVEAFGKIYDSVWVRPKAPPATNGTAADTRLPEEPPDDFDPSATETTSPSTPPPKEGFDETDMQATRPTPPAGDDPEAEKTKLHADCAGLIPKMPQEEQASLEKTLGALHTLPDLKGFKTYLFNRLRGETKQEAPAGTQ
jgi:hypothetical protein